MMRLRTYSGFSLGAAIAIIYHAFSSRGQFYPAMVYLSTSKVSMVLLLNTGLVIMCTLWQLAKCLFLGPLREAEVERLNEQSWREVMEILFAITIFRQDFSVSFLVLVTALLFIKALHWLAQKRVEYIETTPSVPVLSHARIISFMWFLLLVDCVFLFSSLKYLSQTRIPSASLFFSFEYMILATTTISTFVKYVFYVVDMVMEGQWERKAMYTFYLELIRDLLHLSMYLLFFFVIFLNYGAPLHLIRDLYETFRNFKVRVADYIRYRKITSNMNDRFPDATPEELNASDATCIICREEMVTAKKLICGHFFHVHCLRSWLERQYTCPTCRALVVPSENGTSTSGGSQGTPSERIQPGSSGTSGQGSVESRETDNNASHHQRRLQAASAAAAIYQKSFVYPYTNTVAWPSGYVFVPPTFLPPGDADSGESTNGSGDASTSAQQFQFVQNQANSRVPHPSVSFQPTSAQGYPFESRERLLQRQIEVLEDQLQLMRNQMVEVSGSKGKAKVESPGSDLDCGRHGTNEDVNR